MSALFLSKPATRNRLGFRFPLTVVCCHYVVKFIFSAVYRAAYEWRTGKPRVLLGWSESVMRIAPTGCAASLDIGLSNWAFEYITVSLYTMSKSSGIIFLLFFAVLLSLEKLSWQLPVLVLCLALGLFLFTYRSTQFDLTGFFLVELAAACGGMRWAFSQLLMQRQEMGLHSPVDMVFHVQPWMVLSILPLAFAFEGSGLSESAKVFDYRDIHIPIKFFMLILVGGLIALCMELSEYLLLVYTSSLTISVCGIIKEVFTLLLAHHYHHDQFSLVNSLGLCLCLSGISLHVYMKWRKTTQTEEQSDPDLRQLLATDATSDSDYDSA